MDAQRRQAALEVPGGGISLDIGVGGQDHLFDRVCAAVLDAPDELLDLQIFDGHAVQRVERTVQHVVQPLVDARPLQRHHRQRILHDADGRAVALIGAADAARLDVGHVAAHRAEVDRFLHVQEGLGQVADGLRGLAEQMKRQPLRRLGADARQAREGLDGAGDRLDRLHQPVRACREASCRP